MKPEKQIKQSSNEIDKMKTFNTESNINLITTSVELLNYCQTILSRQLLLDFKNDKKRREAEQYIKKTIDILKEIIE